MVEPTATSICHVQSDMGYDEGKLGLSITPDRSVILALQAE